MSLNILESNLHELFAGEKSKCKSLVSDLSGSYIYAAKSGWGIFWSWVFDIAKFLGFEELKDRCFEKAMVQTHRIFKFHLSKAIEAAITYQKAFESKVNGKESPDILSNERRTLFRWHRAVGPFIKQMNSVVYGCIGREISKSFFHQFDSQYKCPLSEGEYSDLLKRQRQCIKLEGIIKAPLPINMLFKASKNEELDKSEKKTLKKFVRELNRNEKYIGVRFLHKVLKAILENGDQQANSDLTRLEMALANLSCSIFLQKDPKHLSMRNSLKTGDKILCNQRELILGERLGDAKAEDQNVIFATDDPHVVVSIGINSVIHSLKRVLVDEESWGIKSARYIDIDENQGVALVERLQDHLGSHIWDSTSDHLSYTDVKVAAPLATLLQWFVAQNKTPVNFSRQYLMFDRQGSLKCTKVALKEDFDFNALERFAFECSAGNIHVYKYLMEKSQLKTHLFATYYAEMLGYALREEKYEAGDVAASMGIIDKRIVEQGRNLVKETLEMKNRCISEIKATSKYSEESGKKISERLLALYQASEADGK